MKVSIIFPRDLDDDLLRIWRGLQDRNPALVSPYFSPELTLAVSEVRDDVHVAVLEEGARVVGLFPFQRVGDACKAVGGALSDHHGVIAEAATRIDWNALLEAAKLDHWRFDHLVESQARTSASIFVPRSSPILDLSRGYAAYRAERKQRSRRYAELDRKARKLAREVGPLRFEVNAPREVLKQVIAWKSEQCRATGVHDYFALPWTKALVERIVDTQTPPFAGTLSALYAGDKLVAAHMGMRSDRCWHWWFPTYAHEFGKYSPGLLLLSHFAEAAAAQGATMVDLGKGDDSYKESFADGALPIAEGFLARPTLMNAARGVSIKAEAWLRANAADRIRPALRALRRLRDAQVYS